MGGSFPRQVMASVSRNVSVKKLEPPKREIFDQVSRGLNLSSCLKMQKYLDSSFENSPCSLSSLVLSRRSSRKTLIVVAIFQCSKYSKYLNIPNISIFQIFQYSRDLDSGCDIPTGNIRLLAPLQSNSQPTKMQFTQHQT